MKEQYGVLGTGTAPKKVIEASLDDVGIKVEYHVPWYGKPSEGLEVVYDWLLDNEATFTIVGTGIPKVLAKAANSVVDSKNPDMYIVDTLKYGGDTKGIAMILWDEDKSDYSQTLAEKCIESELPTLELTNGLVPIVFDEAPAQEAAPVEVVEEDPTEDESFDRPTLENMPAAVVKRMARDKGADVKTKEEAISAILGEEHQPPSKPDRHIVSVTVRYSDGMVMEL